MFLWVKAIFFFVVGGGGGGGFLGMKLYSGASPCGLNINKGVSSLACAFARIYWALLL